jgi:hypothetical protein
MIKLEIGGGQDAGTDSYNLDPVYGVGKWKRKAEEIPWPLANNSLESVNAFHVMEHIFAGEDRIRVMNEVHRILTSSGRFEIRVPLMTPETISYAVADPQHVSYWCRESFDYFSADSLLGVGYGILPWRMITFYTQCPWEGTWIGVPVK